MADEPAGGALRRRLAGLPADDDEPGATPEVSAEVALTKAEVEILDRLAGDGSPTPDRTVAHCFVAVAQLGGSLARSKDPPPGNMVVWRGMTRLMDIHLGSELNRRIVGN